MGDKIDYRTGRVGGKEDRMNIKRAKQEIKHAIEAYLLKDEEGNYEIPSQRQRPIFSDWGAGNWKNTDHGADF